MVLFSTKRNVDITNSQEGSSQLQDGTRRIPFVQHYKYLGVPLDSSLTLKHLESLLKNRIKRFTQRIGLVLHSIVGTKTRLNLWQSYARCLFDYFSPTMLLCGHSSKFEHFFTRSLKKALDLPMQYSNDSLHKVVGIPTLKQIAGHHVIKNATTIHERFNRCPTSLENLAATLANAAEDYKTLQDSEPVKTHSNGTFLLDLLSSEKAFTHNVLGLASGTLLTLRYTQSTEGVVGKVRHAASATFQRLRDTF